MAMLTAASELGYRETNVQDVIERAGVSRPTFYEHFTNKEDCFLAAFDTSAAAAPRARSTRPSHAAATSGAIASAAAWRRCSSSPRRARDRADPDRRGPRGQRRRRCSAGCDCSTRSPAASTPQAREFLPGAAPSPVTAPGVVGGVEALLYSRLCKDEYDHLESLLPSLMYFVVLPYEGHEAAGEEFALEAG